MVSFVLGCSKGERDVGQSQCVCVCVCVCVGGGGGGGGGVPGDIESLATDSLGSTEPESVARCLEVEATEPHSELGPTSVKGKLKSCLQFWESELEAPASVLRTIEREYIMFCPSNQSLPRSPSTIRPLLSSTHNLCTRVLLICWQEGALKRYLSSHISAVLYLW